MKKSAVLLACVAALAGTSAQAFEYTWANPSDALYLSQDYKLPGMSFLDKVSFTLSGQSDLEIAAATTKSPSFGIANGSVKLYDSTDTLVGQLSFNAPAYNGFNTFSSLGAGSYYFTIAGVTTGRLGGHYIVDAAVTPVPEPETYALLLGGLGVVGFIARRRKAV